MKIVNCLCEAARSKQSRRLRSERGDCFAPLGGLATTLGALLLLLGQAVIASPLYDEQYGFHKIAPLVTNRRQVALYAENIEAALCHLFESNSRFELVKAALNPLKEAASKTVPDWKRLMEVVKPFKLQALALFHVSQDGDRRVKLDLMNAYTGEVIFTKEVHVEHPDKLESFGVTAILLMKEATAKFPFDGSILRRTDRFVILDRGEPEIRKGMRLLAQSVEKTAMGLFLEPTGVLVITKAEKDLAFAKIIQEKRAGIIAPGNKILLQAREPEDAFIGGEPDGDDRSPTSLSTLDSNYPFAKGSVGSLELTLGPQLVTLNQAHRSGVSETSGTTIQPGGALELTTFWVGRFFTDAGFGFSTGSFNTQTTNEKVSSTLGHWKVLGGYRFGALTGDFYPSVDFKIGYTRRNFSVDPSAGMAFTSISYQGVRLGGGMRIPVQETWGLGFDVGTLLFTSVDETPVTSGAAIAGANGYDLLFRGYYHFSQNLDLELLATLMSYNAQFEGQGTRESPLISASHSSKAILMAATYYF